MAERDDAGIAEDQVERQREQADDHDLADQHQVAGEQEVGGDRQQPERDLQRLPAVVRQAQRSAGWRGTARFAASCAPRRTGRAGTAISSTTISA